LAATWQDACSSDATVSGTVRAAFRANPRCPRSESIGPAKSGA
jgi:hypothetical protein